MSFTKNATKQTTTEIYRISYILAITHKTIKTRSFREYANANRGHLLKVRYTATKLVVTDIVLGMILEVLKYDNIK